MTSITLRDFSACQVKQGPVLTLTNQYYCLCIKQLQPSALTDHYEVSFGVILYRTQLRTCNDYFILRMFQDDGNLFEYSICMLKW